MLALVLPVSLSLPLFLPLSLTHTPLSGYVNSVDWNGRMELRSGVLDWITEVPRPQIYKWLGLSWL